MVEQENYYKLLDLIKGHQKFTRHDYTPTLWSRVPLAGELSISAGRLGSVARQTFLAELEYQTLRYVVITDHTPLLWFGAFGWLMVPRRHVGGIDNEDFLLILEIAYDLGQDEANDYR